MKEMKPVDEVNVSYRMPFKYIKAIPYGQNMDGYEKNPWPVDAWRAWYYELSEHGRKKRWKPNGEQD